MSRKPLKPLNLNLRLNVTGAAVTKTRSNLPQRSYSFSADMAANSMDSSPNVGLNSPVTSLARNLSELSTRRGTPKRRLSLSSVDTPPGSFYASQETAASTGSSAESGVFVDSPTVMDSPTMEQYGKKTISFRSIDPSIPPPALRLDNDSPVDFMDTVDSEEQSNPLPPSQPLSLGQACSLSQPAFPSQSSFCSEPSSVSLPALGSGSSNSGDGMSSGSFSSVTGIGIMDDCSSQDSGVCLEKDFKIPGRVYRRKSSKLNDICEEANSPHKYSPIKSPQKRPFCFGAAADSPPKEDAPEWFKRSSEQDNDDGFNTFQLEVSEGSEFQQTDQMPSGLVDLITNPLVDGESRRLGNAFAVDSMNTPKTRKVVPAKRMWRSQSVDIRTKRPEPPVELSNESKRWKAEETHDDLDLPGHEVQARKLHRSQSQPANMTAQMSAVERLADQPNLISDSTRQYALPLIKGRHQDLKSITPKTLARLIQGEYGDEVEQFHILDCRYPYEFKGGHIKGAVNVLKDDFMEQFLTNPRKISDSSKRLILIFHCEFSSERAPELHRLLRKTDRTMNVDHYPKLFYPELYLLEGGYKAFFQEYKFLCQPQQYIPMLSKDHAADLRHFRAKSKSWNGSEKRQVGLRAGKRF